MSCKIVVRMKDILEKSKPYIKSRTLGAYKVDSCRYFDEESNTKCIVGTALSDRQIKKLGKAELLEETIESIITGVPDDELDDIVELQSLHDSWAQSNGTGKISVDKYREAFFTFLNKMRKKYSQPKW